MTQINRITLQVHSACVPELCRRTIEVSPQVFRVTPPLAIGSEDFWAPWDASLSIEKIPWLQSDLRAVMTEAGEIVALLPWHVVGPGWLEDVIRRHLERRAWYSAQAEKSLLRGTPTKIARA